VARDAAWRSAARICAWLVTVMAGLIIVGAASITVSGWLIDGVERANGSQRAAAERSAPPGPEVTRRQVRLGSPL
jgi:hypothetical protein